MFCYHYSSSWWYENSGVLCDCDSLSQWWGFGLKAELYFCTETYLVMQGGLLWCRTLLNRMGLKKRNIEVLELFLFLWNSLAPTAKNFDLQLFAVLIVKKAHLHVPGGREIKDDHVPALVSSLIWPGSHMRKLISTYASLSEIWPCSMAYGISQREILTCFRGTIVLQNAAICFYKGRNK